MADPSVSDVVGKIGPPATKIPLPSKIRSGSATVVAYAMIEEMLDTNLMDDSAWLTFWETRGVTRLSQMVWAYVNQDAFADEKEEVFTLRRVQASLNARNLTDYMLAILRAFGQDAFADGFARVLAQQKERIAEAALGLTLDSQGLPVMPADPTTDKKPKKKKEEEDEANRA
jgi:hypothetical protein